MKFAKYLESESIPEWRKAYIDYKGLKKKLKAIEKVKTRYDPLESFDQITNSYYYYLLLLTYITAQEIKGSTRIIHHSHIRR
jgi:hypothetical protein